MLTPTLLPLGDRALLIRFGETLTDEANRDAISAAERVASARLDGVVEVVPNLISVLLRYDPARAGFDRLAGEVRLALSAAERLATGGSTHEVAVNFDGEDVDELAAAVGLSRQDFVVAHNAGPLRVLSTGFAPGFVYCGMHPAEMVAPRRAVVRRQVPAGTVLFAAGQTAITSTPIPTGWHVIGHTEFRNFDPARDPPGSVVAGDAIQFVEA